MRGERFQTHQSEMMNRGVGKDFNVSKVRRMPGTPLPVRLYESIRHDNRHLTPAHTHYLGGDCKRCHIYTERGLCYKGIEKILSHTR